MGEMSNSLMLYLVAACIGVGLASAGIDIRSPDHLLYQGEQVVNKYTGVSIGDNFYTVHPSNYVGADGDAIKLINKGTAIDPTYAQVITFVLQDNTDSNHYTSGFTCGDFAEQLHNNAEIAGYKCGWVEVNFENDDLGHACNAFNTTDRGLVFIDCVNGDATVKIEIGKPYKPHEIRNEGWKYDLLGIVSSYYTYW